MEIYRWEKSYSLQTFKEYKNLEDAKAMRDLLVDKINEWILLQK